MDFLTSMYTNRADFVFTVSRGFRALHPDAAVGSA